MRNNITFTVSYLLKRTKSISSTNHSSIIKYKMGWFDDLFKDTNNNNDTNNNDYNKSNDSGASINWDLYDTINNQNKEPEDRGTIEVPANAETVIYESPDGETYEISISDLIEADDDNEIEHTSAKNKKAPILEPKQSVRPMNKLRKTIKRPQFRLPQPSVIMAQQRFSYIR